MRAATGAMNAGRESYVFEASLRKTFGKACTIGEVHTGNCHRVIFEDGQYVFDYCSGKVIGYMPFAVEDKAAA